MGKLNQHKPIQTTAQTDRRHLLLVLFLGLGPQNNKSPELGRDKVSIVRSKVYATYTKQESRLWIDVCNIFLKCGARPDGFWGSGIKSYGRKAKPSWSFFVDCAYIRIMVNLGLTDCTRKFTLWSIRNLLNF